VLGPGAIGAAQEPLLALLHAPQAEVRLAAARALGTLPAEPPPAAVTTALTALLDDPEAPVRGAAAVALARLGDAAKAAPRLQEALQSADAGLALAAAEAMSDETEGRTAALPVLSVLLAAPDAAVRAQAARVLAQPAYLAPLLTLYETTSAPHLLEPLALLTRAHNIRLLPGRQVVRADGQIVAAEDYSG
jgi:HEAT repeat protein